MEKLPVTYLVPDFMIPDSFMSCQSDENDHVKRARALFFSRQICPEVEKKNSSEESRPS